MSTVSENAIPQYADFLRKVWKRAYQSVKMNTDFLREDLWNYKDK